MTFGHDPDRNPIVQAAKSSAEALNRKRILLFNTTKSHPTTSIFEQAEISKKHLITNLGNKLEKMHHQNTQQGEEEGNEEVNWAEYEEIHERRTLLKTQLQNADYSEDEIKQSTERLNKIKEIDSRGNNESEDTVAQMKSIWKQLVQALLLQKGKSQDAPLVTFINTRTASKDPIAKIARAACSKLNRLVLEEGEDIRAFSARCRAEELYCSWLRALHAPDSSSSENNTVSRHIDEDIDENLFVVLAGALPLSLAYMRASVERESKYGSKFQALRLAIEGEADFLKEHGTKSSKVAFLYPQQHMAAVALPTRISKDPNGAPVSENVTENYQKTVSTNFKLKRGEKRNRDEEEGKFWEEARTTEGVNHIREVDPLVETLWERVLAIESQPRTPVKNTAATLPCFDFRARGVCGRALDCPFLHDTGGRRENPRGRNYQEQRTTTRRSRSPPVRGRYRSLSPPRRHRSPPPRRDRTPPRRNEPPSRHVKWEGFAEYRGKGGKGKGGKGYGKGRGAKGGGKGSGMRSETRVPTQIPFPPHGYPNACISMYNKSRCTNDDCTDSHGVSVDRAKASECPFFRQSVHCPRLFGAGCEGSHGRKNG